LSEKPTDNPFCHLDNKQLAIFRSWLDDHWNWESDDPTSRKLKEMMLHAETIQGAFKIYVSDDSPRTIENIIADVFDVERTTRGDKDTTGKTNNSLKLAASHLSLRLQLFLGEEVVNCKTLMKDTGFIETS
jgi:hypothetical protein